MNKVILLACALSVSACSSEGGTAPSGSATSSGKTPSGKTAKATSSAKASAAPGPTASSAPSAAASSSASAAAAIPEPDKTELTLDTDKDKVVIHSVHHATLYMEVAKKIIWIDPFSEGKLDDKPKADFILITDIHPDHLDEKAIDAIKKPETKIMGPKSVAEKLAGVEVVENGQNKTFGPLSVEAIPMYNIERGPEKGKLFHDKGRGNGYVLSYDKRRIYLSGDTECIPEMKALKDIDLAFVCMNLPYTMTPDEAAQCITAFKPKTLVPYHYRDQDPSSIEGKLKDAGVKMERLRFY